MNQVLSISFALVTSLPCLSGTRTWDGKYDTSNIEVTVVYFVPADRKPLVDWRDRVDYFCKRIEQFHQREFQGQSLLKTIVRSQPLISESTTAELRLGDANAIYFRTLDETDRRLEFTKQRSDRDDTFPILLVLSDINWRPLDDFYRLRPADGSTYEFEGNYQAGQHFPGAASGGARAAYLDDRGIGWGLVSADGWRVPYRGSDCVIYHEGCGHTVGLPHPDVGDGSVMSLGQYQGWINESWLDKDQKSRLQWAPDAEATSDAQVELFTSFRAVPNPLVPTPDTPVMLDLDWPDGAKVESLRVRFQTSLDGPWTEVAQSWELDAPTTAVIGKFERPTPVSYRVDATLRDGATAEIWGYVQVRERPEMPVEPRVLSTDLVLGEQSTNSETGDRWNPEQEVNLLAMIDTDRAWSQGKWTNGPQGLESPKGFGSRIELPYTPPDEYRLCVVLEPLDEPNGLLLGNRSGQNRFVTLFSFATPQGAMSAIENVDGRNVGNETTFTGPLFVKNRISQAIITVRKDRVTMAVDGRAIVNWKGESQRLSLSDYWKTPNDSALFLGAYDCRYLFHRITLAPISGTGKPLP
jgi:hypothetical protein